MDSRSRLLEQQAEAFTVEGGRPHIINPDSHWANAGAEPRWTTADPEPHWTTDADGRRTVAIRGYGAERKRLESMQRSRRRSARLPHERSGFRPDRAAMWAVLLGLVLVLVAATSSHAAPAPPASAPPALVQTVAASSPAPR